MPTYERLDRCLANAEWCRVFPTSSVLHLPMMYSDHAPILLLSVSNRQRPKKPFRFENWWLMEEDFQDVAQTSWNRSLLTPFLIRLVFWLQILGNGADSNRKLEINSTLLKSKF
jgi:hypothetical protein